MHICKVADSSRIFFFNVCIKMSLKLCRVVLFLNKQHIFKTIVLCITYTLVLTSHACLLLCTSKIMNYLNI